MSSVDSVVAQTLDEEKSATEHDHVSYNNDLSNTQENDLFLEELDQTGISLSHVGQVFMNRVSVIQLQTSR